MTQFLLGITVVPREIEDNGYAKFWRLRKVKKAHYGPCENGKFPRFLIILFVILVVHINEFKKEVCGIKWRREKLTNIFTLVSSKF